MVLAQIATDRITARLSRLRGMASPAIAVYFNIYGFTAFPVQVEINVGVVELLIAQATGQTHKISLGRSILTNCQFGGNAPFLI